MVLAPLCVALSRPLDIHLEKDVCHELIASRNVVEQKVANARKSTGAAY